ncbi:unnamed protein product [Caenorhabditis auriculariae]|uniref:Transposase Tc1-like domain-containing protein n=1 Tax=Caenorhabditis auriculariae TaxID=2777116 RepID=A0A8S1H776_9PELO|nr:unnamed protein product [Caenorhabditis auriculariae]
MAAESTESPTDTSSTISSKSAMEKLIPIDLPQEQPDKYLAVEQLMRGYDHIRKQIEDEIKKDAVPRPKRPDLSKYRIVNPSFRRKKRSENTDPETLGRFGSSNSPSSSSKEIEVITIGDDDDDPIRKLDENEKNILQKLDWHLKTISFSMQENFQRVFLGNFVLAPNHGDIETVTYDDKKLPTFAPERVMFLPKKWRNARVSPELSQSPPTTNIPATKQAEIPVENDEDEESMRHSVLYNIVRSCNSNIPGCATANPAQEELSVEVGDVISELTSLIYNGSPATNDVPEDQGDTSSSSPSALPDYTANDGAFPLLTPENSENLLHLALECCTSTPAFSPNVTSPSSRRQWKSKSCQPTPQKAKSPAKKVKTKWVSKVPPEKRRNRVKKSETPQPQPQENKKEASPKDKNKKRGASEVEELQNFVADQAKQIHAHLAALDLPEESYDHEEIQDPAKNSKRPSEERSLTPALIIDEDYVPGDNFDLAPLDRLVYTPIPDNMGRTSGKKDLTDNDKRAIVVGRQNGLTMMTLAGMFGVTEACISQFLKRWKAQDGSTKSQRTGRPRVTDLNDDRNILKTSRTNPRLTAPVIRREVFLNSPSPPSVSTVKRRLNAAEIMGRRPVKKPLISG